MSRGGAMSIQASVTGLSSPRSASRITSLGELIYSRGHCENAKYRANASQPVIIIYWRISLPGISPTVARRQGVVARHCAGEYFVVALALHACPFSRSAQRRRAFDKISLRHDDFSHERFPASPSVRAEVASIFDVLSHLFQRALTFILLARTAMISC